MRCSRIDENIQPAWALGQKSGSFLLQDLSEGLDKPGWASKMG